MKFILTPELLLPFVISNALAIWILWMSFRKAHVAKGILAILFLGSAAFNIYLSFTDPASYRSFADTAISPLYRDFIHGVFSQHTTLIVSTIGVGQIFIGTSMLMEGLRHKVGCIAGSLFGLAIAPLGVGSAFPSSLVLSICFIVLLLKKEETPATV